MLVWCDSWDIDVGFGSEFLGYLWLIGLLDVFLG